MSAAKITFIGGADCGDVGQTVWGNDATGRVTFPLRQPVVVDPASGANVSEREFLSHVIEKAKGNRFFTVEKVDGKDGDGAKATVEQPKPQSRTQPNKRRKKDPEPEAA